MRAPCISATEAGRGTSDDTFLGWSDAGLHDARTVIEPPDATMLLPEPGGEDATIVSAPAHGGMAVLGHPPVKLDAPVTLPEECYAVGGEIARGGSFYRLRVRLPSDFLKEERAAGRLT